MMRKLKTTDLFEAMRLIKKANLREELRPIIIQAANSNLAIEEVGIDGMLGVIEILSGKKAEQGLYDFLAGPFEMEPAEVSDLPINDLLDNLTTLSQENNLTNFMSALQGLITKK